MPSGSRWRGLPMLVELGDEDHPPPRRHAGAAAARHDGRVRRRRRALRRSCSRRRRRWMCRSPSPSNIPRAWATPCRASGSEIGNAPVFEKLAFSCWRDAAIKKHMIGHHEKGRPLVILAGIEVACLRACRRRWTSPPWDLASSRWPMPWHRARPPPMPLALERMRQNGVAHRQHRDGGVRTAGPGRNRRIQGALGACALRASSGHFGELTSCAAGCSLGANPRSVSDGRCRIQLGRPARPRIPAHRRRAHDPRRRPRLRAGQADAAREIRLPRRALRPRDHERDGRDGLPRRHDLRPTSAAPASATWPMASWRARWSASIPATAPP